MKNIDMQQKVNHKRHKETPDLFLKFSTIKVPTSPLRSPQRSKISFNPKPPQLSPRSTWFSTMNPHEEEFNTNFSGLNHKPWELSGDV
jgi:hypothetical protein